jgi:desulfoferrodoxin-like iron-binding protein
MTQKMQLYSCGACGQLVTVVHGAGGRLVCCNRPMLLGDEKREKVEEPAAPGSPFWRCSNCRYVLQSPRPPEVCPSCHQNCQFSDVTCYIPECGFSGVDGRLV